jgi:hypothetical protein
MRYEKTFSERAIPNLRVRSTVKRFLKGTTAGVAALFLLVIIAIPKETIDSVEVQHIFILSLMYGSLVGIILAFDKWNSFKS